MVYAEERLHRKVDWRSIRTSFEGLESIDIPKERKYKGEGGLGKGKKDLEPIADACVEWSDDSDVDMKSGCTKEEMDQKLKTLRAAQLDQFLEEVLEDKDIEGVAFEMEKKGSDCSVDGPSSNPSDPIAQHLAELDEWEATAKHPTMTEEFIHTMDEEKEMSNEGDASLLERIEELETQLHQQKEDHSMQLENVMRDFSIKEEAYKQRIQDLERALQLTNFE